LEVDDYLAKKEYEASKIKDRMKTFVKMDNETK